MVCYVTSWQVQVQNTFSFILFFFTDYYYCYYMLKAKSHIGVYVCDVCTFLHDFITEVVKVSLTALYCMSFYIGVYAIRIPAQIMFVFIFVCTFAIWCI